MVLLDVGLVAPGADRLGGGCSQNRVSLEKANVSDRTVFGDLDFEDNVTGAIRGEGCGGILRLSPSLEASFGLLGIEPDAWGRRGRGRGDLGGRRCLCDRVIDLFAGSSLRAEDHFTFFVDD